MIDRPAWLRIFGAVLLAGVLAVSSAGAAEFVARPLAADHGAAPLAGVVRHQAAPLDLETLAREDVDREAAGMPYRFAAAETVELTPRNSGTWELLPGGGELWRLRVGSPGALSLNLGFTSCWLPAGSQLAVSAVDGSGRTLVFDERDNRGHGQLWTPLLEADEIVVELFAPDGAREAIDLVLGAINTGYREFAARDPQKIQSCEIDVVCSEGDGWRDEIDSVGVYTVNGIWKCTGTLVNNTAQDGRPLFLTASHCHIYDYLASTVVVYWNYQSETCGDLGAVLDVEQSQTGSTLLADYPASDVTLIELDQIPDPAFGVKYAGWDRSTDVPNDAVCIHHPSTDVKCISFENHALSITSWSMVSSPGDGTHLMVSDWDAGSTEGGSSGSALFNSAHRVVGQLHGGWAACDNDDPDWFGRFAISWDGGGTSETRLSDHLDPGGTGSTTTDLYVYVPPDYPFEMTWSEVFQPSGLVGGPFRPASGTVVVENTDTENRTVTIEPSVDWMGAAVTEAEIPAGENLSIQIFLTSAAASLPAGDHEGVLAFIDESGGGQREYDVILRVGGAANLQLVGFYPNPFGSWAELRFDLDYAFDCSVKVYDLRGRLVRDLGRVQGVRGANTVVWNGRSDAGGRAPAGAYVCVVEGGGREVNRAVTLVR